jgi:hypothetical protein
MERIEAGGESEMPKSLRYVVGGIVLAVVTVYLVLALRLTNLLFIPVVSGTRLPPASVNPQSAAMVSEAILRDQMWRVERTIDLLTLIMAVGTIALGFAAFIGYQVIGGLIYYYAQAGVREKKDVALEYAKWAREQMNKISWPQPIVLIANDLYVRMRYGNRRPQLEAVREA